MASYLIKRLFNLVLVLLGVTVVVFLITHLTPGDPAAVFLGEGATREEIEQFRRVHYLDQSLPRQYFHWLTQLLQGDWGSSIIRRQPVLPLLLERLPNTIVLAAAGLSFGVLFGLPAGILTALYREKWQDLAITAGVLLGVSTPGFWKGLVFIIVFAATLHWLPASGMGSIEEGLWDYVRYLLGPAISIGLGRGAGIARMTRTAVLEVLGREYLRTARAKGLHERVVLYRHILPNALIPVVTIVGLQLGTLLGGTVVMETVFSWPGIGRLAVQAILGKDFPVIQGTMLVVAALFAVVNLIVDMMYGFLDPRIEYS